MKNFSRFAGLTIVALASGSLLTGEALACLSCGKGNARKGCSQLVTVKHPDMQGDARKKEIDRCVQNPDAYNG